MNKGITMKDTTKRGIAIFIVLTLTGLLVGWVLTEKGYTATPVQAAAPIAMTVDCDSGTPCRTSEVRYKRQGVRKFGDGLLGKQVGLTYPAKAKDIILDKLMRRQRAMATTARLAADYQMKSRSEMWAQFKRQDNCYYRANPGPGTWAIWSCDDPSNSYAPTDPGDWTRRNVRAVICGTVVGISIKGAMATGAASGPGAGWVWAGLGSAWATCMWQDQLEKMYG